MEYQYIYIDNADSTNNYAKSFGDVPNDTLTIIRAGRQTGGRGRGGRQFFSDHAGGLWVSIVTPINDISTHFEHNRAISLAILESLKNTAGGSAPVTIKWPNDIYWGNRKITGILLENIPDNPGVLIIGFGINVNMEANDFPNDLRGTVTSVLIETGKETPLDRLLDDIINGYHYYQNIADQDTVHEIYSGSLYRLGSRVTIGRHSGKFIAVETDGRLKLETDNGDVHCSSGTLLFNE